MGRECSHNGKMQDCFKTSTGKPTGKDPIGRLGAVLGQYYNTS